MSFDKDAIKQDVRAIEHAKTDSTAEDAALLLRNDIARMKSPEDRKQALDLVHRTNVYDRAEDPKLPKIDLISDEEYPKYKVGTEIKYDNGKVIHEGRKPLDQHK